MEAIHHVRYIGLLPIFVLILKYFFFGHASGYLIALTNQLAVLKCHSLKLKRTLADRAFSSAAPNLGNNLPLHHDPS